MKLKGKYGTKGKCIRLDSKGSITNISYMCNETRNMVAAGGTTTYMSAFMLVEYTEMWQYYIQYSMDRSLKTIDLHVQRNSVYVIRVIEP